MNSISMLFKLYQLKRNQWLEKEELERLQEAKLRALIIHAYKNVLYYHRLFDSVGIKPEDIKTVDDLRKIPITTKSTLQSLPISEISSQTVNLNQCLTERTSGSTGEPFTIFFSRDERDFIRIGWTKAFVENGIKYRDKRACIFDLQPQVGKSHWFQYFGLWNNINISCFDELEDQIRLLKMVRPKLIFGFPSSLSFIAMKIKEERISEISPKAIFTSAEMLDQKTRGLLDDVFGVRTFDFYGSEECGLIAWECPEHDGYHINADTHIVEFIKDGEPTQQGESGEIICTNLHSYTMPFIRYSVGDIGTPRIDGCLCGRGLPLMNAVEGRVVDCLLLPSGRIVSPYLLINFFTHGKIQGIAQYQIIQEKKDKITIKLVKNDRFAEGTIQQIEREYKRILVEDIEINPVVVDEIPRHKSGKFKVVMSMVNK